MRVYHFLSAKNAEDDLAKKRIKLSEVDKLNDPFVLWWSANPQIRKVLSDWRNEVVQRFAILCVCKQWHNPVLWSHYGDSHRGICLGFDVDERSLKSVTYVRQRPPLRLPPTLEVVNQVLFTKYWDWRYEEEVRGWFSVDKRDPLTGHYFYNFDEKIQLREVIAGPLCVTPKGAIDATLKDYEGKIRVIKSRLAFTTFRVVTNGRGFR
jgi:hypothetical protein